MNKVTTLLFCLLSVVALVGCGDDSSGPEAYAPAIGTPALTCGPYVGDGNLRYDGDILLGISVNVTDVDGDLASVTASIQGTVLKLEGNGDSFSYEQKGVENMALRCEGDEVLTIRAVDEKGHVGVLEFDPSAE